MQQAGRRAHRAAATVVVLVAVLATALGIGPLTGTARAAYVSTSLSSFDSRLVHDINHARANRGLRPLTVTAGTTDVAHGWSCRLSVLGLLEHNPLLAVQLATHGSSLWTMYAENVGMLPAGSGADRLFRAYMASPEHRANILDPSARFIGVWSKKSNGVRYNTIDFVGSTRSAYDDSYGAARRTC
jgi:uncharacterized protein YkwD